MSGRRVSVGGASGEGKGQEELQIRDNISEPAVDQKLS